MTRRFKYLCSAALAIVLLSLACLVLYARTLNPPSVETADEIDLGSGYSEKVRRDGYPISVVRAFSVSAYGGWHGDGSSVTIRKHLPAESPALIEVLKRLNPSYTWNDELTSSDFLSDVRHLIPSELLPRSESSRVLRGRMNDNPTIVFYIVPNEGLWYIENNRL